MHYWQRPKEFLLKNKTNLIRETRFVAVLFLWVAFYVLIMRHRWTQIEERDLMNAFLKSTESSFEQFESRHHFWQSQANRVANFVNEQTPATLKLQQDSWSVIYDSHPEWLATHVVAKRQGYEPAVALSLFSRQVRDWFPQDKDSPIHWSDEVQSSAVQLISSKIAQQPMPMQLVRSIDKENQWVQILFKIKKSNPGWSTWVVHTFSAKLLPELQSNSNTIDSILYFPTSKKHITSKNFANQKIEMSELVGVLDKSYGKDSGFSAQSFAIAKKNVWLSWRYSKELDASFVRVLPENQIPSTGQRETPSLFADWLLSFIWMIMSALGLWLSYRKNLWRLSIADIPVQSADFKNSQGENDPYSKNRHKTLASALNSIIDTEMEFCRRLLCEVGPVGDIALIADAQASVEVTPSPFYKGSWWIIENVDQNRILIAIGDASGQGMAAGTAAFSVRNFIQMIVRREGRTRETEHLLSLVYDRCRNANDGLSLGSAHVSLFAGIFELEQQKFCFLNAGYPAPILRLGGKKQLCLTSYFDPIGLGRDNEEPPLPRWININFKSELVLCNIGAQNTDLDELENSELIKIYVYPFGAHELSQHPELSKNDRSLTKDHFEAA